MANQAYLSIWVKNFSADTMLEQFGNFLGTVPFSAKQPGFTHLEIRAVDSTETPVFEQDLRAFPLDAAGVIELAKDYLHDDCSCAAGSRWDLWVYEGEPPSWQQSAQALELLCHGEAYDDGFWKENGHFEVNFGFEHLFTGHGGLLGFRQVARPAPQSQEERDFLESMSKPANLLEYQEKTRENIKSLFAWVRRIEAALPVAQLRLWSEGEENFEARLEEILATR
ncbi:MAG: hypothetical protein WA192_09300 [Candidatus Acidiferrales bacterium]